MEHHEASIGELGAEHLERDAMLVRPEEQNMIGVVRDRVCEVDRVRAVFDDVPCSSFINPVP